MKTKRKIIAWVFVVASLFSSCTAGQFSDPTSTPIRTSTFTPTQASTPSQTSTFTPMPSATVTSIPTWVTNFADPILQSIENRPADFQDDFSQNNRGWKYFPYAGSGPLSATIQNGVMSVAATSTDTEKTQVWVEHPDLTGKDFVLSFDFSIDEGDPEDHLLIMWFLKTSFRTLWLNQNDIWSLGTNTPKGRLSGNYNYNSSAQNSVLIISKDDQCGIYVNHAAIAYLSECRASSSGTEIWISLSAFPGSHTAIMSVDNVKLWNLDNPPK